ncbi:MAG: L,D-transpeptidase family protein [Deltaproteobacteria bacterium]|nr:L,D-transpeptidase family protein [Deltaproteobacteria bacterium]
MLSRILIPLLLCVASVQAQVLPDPVAEELRSRLEAAPVPVELVVEGESIDSPENLVSFYQRRVYQPAWSHKKGLLREAGDLIRSLHKANEEGLYPEEYHLVTLERIVSQLRQASWDQRAVDPEARAVLDLLLTDAFLTYAKHLFQGRVRSEKEMDSVALLEKALNEKEISKTLERLLPVHSAYARLRHALARYREIGEQGGWFSVAVQPPLKKGDTGEAVIALRRRLEAEGVSFPKPLPEEVFDDILEEEIQLFQRRHGLEPDGVVGNSTLEALNVSVEDRIHQIELNMERWRWMPEDLGKRRVQVNIASFELEVLEKEESVIKMRVIVGRSYRQTPVFSDKIRYLVLNPHWYVPRMIAVNDLLPEIQQDPSVLQRKKIRVYEGNEGEIREVDLATIDWTQVTPSNFRYRLQQDPGANNALGRIKFMFPNPYDVYLHDTPSQELFERTVRNFSSGCIRVEKPLELAEYLLRGDSRWNPAKLQTAIDRGTEQTVRLPEPVSIHLLYWTAWVDSDGAVQFRNDLYGRDRDLALTLQIH